MRKDTILVTGATGFLGSWLRKKLNQTKYNIFLTASKNYPEQNIHKLNLTNFGEVNYIVKKIKPSIIYHLAAHVNLSRNFNTLQKCIDINLRGTINLLESLKSNPPDKFIFTSTEEVYGNGSVPFREIQLPLPPSAYSISKLAGEQFCQMYAAELKMSLYIFRIATFYGPENPINRYITQVILNALKNEKILSNSGYKKRDYIFIEDVIAGLLSVLSIKKTYTQIFNLGGGKSYTLKHLIDKIIEISGSKSKIILNAFPDRTGESDEWLMDNGKAKKILGWEPKTSLSEGLKKTIKYFKQSLI